MAAVEIDLNDGDDWTAGTITICRDIPGEHTGGPDCFCCPRTFRVDDDAAINAYLASEQYEVS